MNTSVFSAYLELGFHHIFSVLAYDHLAFLVALSARYIFADWRKVVLLTTSFTIGHSVTLALSVLNVVTVDSTLIETLIPITILLTSLANFLKTQPKDYHNKALWFSGQNLAAASFGLIHGLGFSNYLKQLLGSESKPVLELFSFNLGIELAQVLIVLAALLLNTLAVRFFPRKRWTMLVSGITALVSVYILFDIFNSAV